MSIVTDIVSIVLITTGLIFYLGAAIGMIRFPDFYCRMHAAGKGDTLSTLLILVGFGIQQFESFSAGEFVFFVKMLIICLFIFTTSPTATHELIRAGYEVGATPWTKNPAGTEEAV
jgi:multicomponent Na+:H+ antiporter subunit G